MAKRLIGFLGIILAAGLFSCTLFGGNDSTGDTSISQVKKKYYEEEEAQEEEKEES